MLINYIEMMNREERDGSYICIYINLANSSFDVLQFVHNSQADLRRGSKGKHGWSQQRVGVRALHVLAGNTSLQP